MDGEVARHPDVLDRALLERHVQGDPTAFSELVRRHQDRLWAVALRTLGHPEEAALPARVDPVEREDDHPGGWRGERRRGHQRGREEMHGFSVRREPDTFPAW